MADTLTELEEARNDLFHYMREAEASINNFAHVANDVSEHGTARKAADLLRQLRAIHSECEKELEDRKKKVLEDTKNGL